jgi:hypothetical protein
MVPLLTSLFLSSLLASAAADPRPVLVIVGMETEAQTVKAPGILVIKGAGNGTLLRSRLQGITHDQVRAVVSFGIAGALNPALVPGDPYVGGQVRGETKSWDADPALSSFLNQGSKTGIVLAYDDIKATDAASRATLRANTTGDIEDQESHIAAEFAASEGLPFSLLRAVADTASQTLAPAALLPLTPNGEPDTSAILYSVLMHPWQVADLLALSNATTAALETLKAAIAKIDWSQAPGAEVRGPSSTSHPPYPRASPKNQTVRK